MSWSSKLEVSTVRNVRVNVLTMLAMLAALVFVCSGGSTPASAMIIVSNVEMVAVVDTVIGTCVPQCHSFGVLIKTSNELFYVHCQADSECNDVRKGDCVYISGVLESSALRGGLYINANETFAIIAETECSVDK